MFYPASAAQMLAMDVLAYDKMKSNRRKQSKPIRVSYSAEADPSKEQSPGQYPSQVMPEEFIHAQKNGRNIPEQDYEEEMMPKPNYQTNTPNFSPKPKESSFPPEENRPPSQIDIEPRENNNEKFSLPESFPTKYHRLGNELQQGNAFLPNGQDDSNNNRNENPEDLSAGSKDINPDEEGRKIDGTNRIFHRDAYCDLCDREFCNKYFLKTHKANKHGIFENSPPPPFSMSPFGASLPQDTLFTPSSSSATSPLPFPRPSPAMSSLSSFKIMDFIQNLPASEQKTPTKLEQPPVTSNKPDPLPTPTKSDSQPLVPTTSASNTPSSSSNKPVSKDMEDFCELCQKHFCNKYYLKKHKQDVHGIAPPDGGGSGKRGRPKDLQAQLDAISSVAVTSNSPLIPHSLPSMAGLPPGVMVLNPFMAPMLIPAGSLMPGQQLPTPPVQGMPTSSHSDSINTSASLQSSMSPSSDANRPGTVESFCDLCHKEFCNKYFLKIHMANKHGIFTDDLPLLPGMPGMPPFKFPMGEKSPVEKPPAGGPPEEPKDHTKMETSPKPGLSMVSNVNSADSSVNYCALCNQEFASKYSYRIHRLQAHGMLSEGFDSSITEEIIKNSFREKEEYYRNAMKAKEEAVKVSPGSKSTDEGHTDTKISENGMTTMFGNMVAAKLADRVTCDICNKDLCNKYFLKVHKFKVHGVDTTHDNRFDPSKISKNQLVGDFELIKNAVSKQDTTIKQEARDFSMFSQKRPSPMNFSMFPKANDILRDQSVSPSLNVEKPSNEELVKMGIDPEAYCEICKKEFCSKYFLRTHRLNIHGISTPSTPNTEKYSEKLTMSNNKPLNLSMGSQNSAKKLKTGNEKHSWRWKEPVNATRVTCDICNKEVCNKFFLRTHKLNKHGILPSESSLSPATSDIETTSNSSLPTDLSMHDRNGQSPQTVKLECNIPSGNNGDHSPAKFDEDMMNSQYYDDPYRRFKNSKMFNAHVMNDHGARMGRMNSAAYDFSVDPKTCRICEAVFPSEISMHLHMIQEHNAQVTLNTEEGHQERRRKSLGANPKFAMKRRFSFVSKQKQYSCSVCDYRSQWLNNVYIHERKEHKVLNKKRKMRIEGNDENRMSGSTKKYRCTKCNMKFATPILCHLHIREDHIRSKTFHVNNHLSTTRFTCKFCNFSTKFSKQLRHHMTRVHRDGRCLSVKTNNDNILTNENSDRMRHQDDVMIASTDGSMLQQFRIKDCSMDTEFPLSMVNLPVRHRLSGPVTVTFQLSPVEQ
ncbi:hypothetical protein FSP39_018017 [Pinctada imbricata]|uniref:C2H2-type domain-containing protein n=1 Tax=Pinctada imbricata TaxID=66713 RepID=A0AA88XRX3_PINIB|nr:hypothetical protein FSP39_018017 [Pinctada imbricata]